MPINVLRHLPSCSFDSFWFLHYCLFINKPDSSTDLIIFPTPSISSFEIIKVIITDSKIFLCIAVYVDDVAAVDPTGVYTLWTNSLNTFFIIDKQVLSSSPKRVLKNPPDCAV